MTSTLTVRRIKTGRAPKDPPTDDVYSLYAAGARGRAHKIEIETMYLGGSDPTPVPCAPSDKVEQNRLARYGGAIAGIRSGAFLADPSDRECPGCPFLFICPAPEPPVPPVG